MACIRNNVVAGLKVITLDRAPIQEHFVTLTPNAGESAKSFFQRVGEAVDNIDGQVIMIDVLGASTSAKVYLPELRKVLGESEPPITWVRNTRSDHLCGVHLWFVAGTPVSRVRSADRVVGSLFEDDNGRYCRLSGILPTNPSDQRVAQAEEVFCQMESILASTDMTFSDVFRTWFYNDNILAWYGEFNGVRDRFFQEKGVFDRLMPASTGIGGGNIADSALTGGLLAIEQKGVGTRISEVPSPFQSSAADYGSSFSRAVEVACPDHRRIYVSGTASIDEAGKTVFIGDVQAQVKLTMEVVEAILQSRDMDWADVVRSLVYFKSDEDMSLFETYRKEHDLPRFPAIVTENDVCRGDLLFEIEVDAIKPC